MLLWNLAAGCSRLRNTCWTPIGLGHQTDGGRAVGLSWQQGPLSPGAIGRFLVPERELHSAVRRAARGAAQRGNRGDACSGDAARAGGGSLDTAGPLAARRSRSAAPSIRRRSPPPHASPPAPPPLCLLQQAVPPPQDGRGF